MGSEGSKERRVRQRDQERFNLKSSLSSLVSRVRTASDPGSHSRQGGVSNGHGWAKRLVRSWWKWQCQGSDRREGEERGGIAELLAPGKGRWGQFFSLIWATGKWIFTGSEEPLNLGEEKFLFLFTGTRSLSGQMCVRGRWRQGKRSVFTAKCPGLGLREALARQPSHKLVVCPWPS